MINFIKLLIKKNKILFIPIFLAIGLFGLLLFVSKGSVLAPFIYTLF
jgi:hypothetical protein